MSTSDMDLVVSNRAIKSLHSAIATLSSGVPALGLVNGGHHLAPAVCGEQILCAQLVEVAGLNREFQGVAKLDIDLVGIIIECKGVVLVLVVEGLEEGATELPDLVELGVDIAKDRISLKERGPDQVCVGATIS